MSPAPKPLPTLVIDPPTSEHDTRLRVVDADSYIDWEPVYRDKIDRLFDVEQ
jgi:hypothetical protein